MSAFFAKLAALLRQAVGFVFPIFTTVREHRGIRWGLLWFLHVLVVVGITVLLYFVNQLPRILSFIPNPLIQKVWLPVLFLLLYLLAWQAYWIYRLLTEDEPVSDFPDIDDAWEEAKAKLRKAGIDLTAVPIFLVLGRPSSKSEEIAEDGIFTAAQLSFRVRGVPRQADAPLHVYGSDEAIFVTCANASLLGKFALLLATKSGPATGGGPGQSINWQQMSVRLQGTLLPANLRAMLAGANTPIGGVAGGHSAPAALANSLSIGAQPLQPAGPQLPGKHWLPRLNSMPNLPLWSNRLAHLCRLIVRDRRPFCPVNGILVLLPMLGSDNDEAAEDCALACRRDLDTAQAVLRVHCPRIVMLADLETMPGFTEFVGRFAEADRRRPLGKGFPLVPDVPRAADIVSEMDPYTSWICGRVFSDWVYRFFRLESPGKRELGAAIENNKNLFYLSCQMIERQQRVSRILKAGVIEGANGAPLFGGCYVAGTGRDPAKEQAFVDGVVRRLVSYQEIVMWTDQALQEEKRAKRRTFLGYSLLAGFVIVDLAFILFRLFTR